MVEAVDIPNMGLPPRSGNACLPCIHNHLGILVPAIGLAKWGANIVAFGVHCLCVEDIVQARGILSKLDEHCLCLENIVQAVRILKQLESNFLPTPATQIEPSMATGWREIRIKGIQVKNI